MKKWSIYLGICLAVQVALAVGGNLARTDYTAFKPMETLLSFDAKMVDDILIEQNDEQRVTLRKQAGWWRVSSLNNFQADRDKVEDFLEKLASVHHRAFEKSMHARRTKNRSMLSIQPFMKPVLSLKIGSIEGC